MGPVVRQLWKDNFRVSGDGTTYLYNNDLAQYADHFWSTVDPYRLPGPTVDTHARSNGSGQETPNTTWVGVRV